MIVFFVPLYVTVTRFTRSHGGFYSAVIGFSESNISRHGSKGVNSILGSGMKIMYDVVVMRCYVGTEIL